MNIETDIPKFTPSNYNKFYWWRRFKPRTPPFKNRPLLAKIKNGDYDYSDYRVQALYELELAQEKANKFPIYAYTERDEVIKMGRLRHNKLMEDFMKDEFNLLKTIEKEFCDEFWLSKEDFTKYLNDCYGSLEDLYHTIKEDTLYKFRGTNSYTLP
jgi:hypothetical protein